MDVFRRLMEGFLGLEDGWSVELEFWVRRSMDEVMEPGYVLVL